MKKIPPENPVDWHTFGRFLFSCYEADPGYYILDYLRQDGVEPDQLKRFVVAWTAFYNLGIAAKASEYRGKQFYDYLHKVYPTAKRASERRHFRGQAGLNALAQWQRAWPKPEHLADYVMHRDMGKIRDRCSEVMLYGDYFKWKWGDLTEVLLQKSVMFQGWEHVSPKVPQQGAALIAKEAGKPGMTTAEVYRGIAKQMVKAGVRSPYAPWREFNVQDAETICCVYKQYRSGGYFPGLRTAKAAVRLATDGEECETARRALKLLLKNQPVKQLTSMDRLNNIASGELRYNVEDLYAPN